MATTDQPSGGPDVFTFNLVTGDGAVWDTVTVRADSITDAAATLASTGLTIVLV
jgi:hypothetical protein